MKKIIVSISTVALAFGFAGQGAAKSSNDKAGILQQGLDDMVEVTPLGQANRPNDPDQGDDNAALRAISEVCTKDNPAADRSAICPSRPVSPE